MSLTIHRRPIKEDGIAFSSSTPPLLQRIYSSRGVYSEEELQYTLSKLYDYRKLKDIEKAAEILSSAIIEKNHILIVGDFDADGATSSALAIAALHSFGATNPNYIVPNRFEFGYGLTPGIVEVAKEHQPDVLVTVDNGISSLEGVAAAKAHGMQVVITDHHLAGEQLPEADAIVNPNQPGCLFPGKNTAGVGVIFYVMCAVRALLDKQGWFSKQRSKPNMAELLDLVALGTVADVVSLDQNNRILVHQGLQRIRIGRVRPGIQALIDVTNRKNTSIVSSDMGFSLGPRLNAAGRLDDMSIGIELLLSTDIQQAKSLAVTLDELNVERRAIEESMRQEAMSKLEALSLEDEKSMLPSGVCLYQDDWHQGVIGILAARVKEKTYRPVIAFAQGDEGLIKGSARSVSGFHIRDALALINSRFPGLLIAFGGHAMAAGLTLKESDFEQFKAAFEQVASEYLSEDQLTASVVTDGDLTKDHLTLSTAEMLHTSGPWGQSFPEPLFDGVFHIVDQKLLKEKHLKLTLQHPDSSQWIDAILFNADRTIWPDQAVSRVRVVYQLDINEFRGQRNVQMLLRHLEKE